MIDDIQRWSRLAGLSATVAEAGPPLRVQLQLEDIRPPMTVDVLGPATADDPYRFSTGFDLPPAAGSGLSAERVAEIIEAAVLQRSALADARRRPDGSGVEMIAVIYADSFSRHTFMTAIYECQKLRQIITREVESALVAEAALSSLLVLAESSEQLATAVAEAAAEPPPPLPEVPPTSFSTPAPSSVPPHGLPPLPDDIPRNPSGPPQPERPWEPPPLPNVPPPLPPT